MFPKQCSILYSKFKAFFHSKLFTFLLPINFRNFPFKDIKCHVNISIHCTSGQQMSNIFQLFFIIFISFINFIHIFIGSTPTTLHKTYKIRKHFPLLEKKVYRMSIFRLII